MSHSFRVVALISTFNEADILRQALDHLAVQGVEAYVLDDGSTDGTAEIAESRLGAGVIGLERMKTADDGRFSWRSILERKSQLAAELDADWFIHHDADEFRESPWDGVSLKDGIELVSRLGYSALSFLVLHFRPTDDRFQPGMSVDEAFLHYEPAEAFDRLQIKCWKKQSGPVDLAESGGHEARFTGRRVFPVRFLLRHYPIRSRAHGRRKVLSERLSRYDPDERRQGWHHQYDAIAEAGHFQWQAQTLIEFDSGHVKDLLAQALDDEAAISLAETRVLWEKQHLEATLASTTERLHELTGKLELERGRAQLDRENFAEETRIRSADVARLSARIDDLLRSKSWRLTGPLRAIARVVRAGPGIGETGVEKSAAIRPVSWRWGLDRGLPIDRHYIHQFLADCAGDIRGKVLEVKDGGYTRMFGGSAVTDAHVLDIDASNEQATVVGDLSHPQSVQAGPFDCFILTQTLHIIYDLDTALSCAAGLLAPGGVLLCTVPAVSRVNDENGGLESGDYWRCTHAAVRRLFADVSCLVDVNVTTYGNVRTCAAFLYGLAAEDLTAEELGFVDPWFPLVHCVRAVRRTS